MIHNTVSMNKIISVLTVVAFLGNVLYPVEDVLRSKCEHSHGNYG